MVPSEILFVRDKAKLKAICNIRTYGQHQTKFTTLVLIKTANEIILKTVLIILPPRDWYNRETAATTYFGTFKSGLRVTERRVCHMNLGPTMMRGPHLTPVSEFI